MKIAELENDLAAAKMVIVQRNAKIAKSDENGKSIRKEIASLKSDFEIGRKSVVKAQKMAEEVKANITDSIELRDKTNILTEYLHLQSMRERELEEAKRLYARNEEFKKDYAALVDNPEALLLVKKRESAWNDDMQQVLWNVAKIDRKILDILPACREASGNPNLGSKFKPTVTEKIIPSSDPKLPPGMERAQTKVKPEPVVIDLGK